MGVNKKQFYKFNLLPPKSKEELAALDKRDNSIFFSFVLIFFGVLIILFLNLIELLQINPVKANIQTDINDAETKILSDIDVKALNGELVLKSNLLSPNLSSNVEVKKIIEISNSMVGGAKILSYGREGNGKIRLAVKTKSLTETSDVIKSAKANTNIANVLVNRISKDNNDEYTLNFSFEINLSENGSTGPLTNN